MSSDELKKKQEEARKSQIIDGRIEMLLERLHRQLSDERRHGLREMTVAELENLAAGLEATATALTANEMIVGAICSSRNARRAEEDKMLAGFPPAEVSMTI